MYSTSDATNSGGVSGVIPERWGTGLQLRPPLLSRAVAIVAEATNLDALLLY